jgi:hypothetical protein
MDEGDPGMLLENTHSPAEKVRLVEVVVMADGDIFAARQFQAAVPVLSGAKISLVPMKPDARITERLDEGCGLIG